MSECDLLIALGARFSDRVVGNAKKFASNARILHIDIEAAEINKNMRADAALVGDLKEILDTLNESLPPVSYTHLDVYKRQFYTMERRPKNGSPT